MSRILCTGGAGFIGSHLVDKLISLNHDVSIIDNLSSGNKDNINEKAHFHECDINDVDGLRAVFEKERPEFIFHLAAQINLRESFNNPAVDAQTNIVGSLNLIQLAKEYKLKKFIFTSTGGAIYDVSKALPWSEKMPANPKSPYGLAKLTVEKYLDLSELNHICFRLANVYGPRQNSKGEAGVVSIFIDKALAGENLTIFGDGTQTRDFIYVSDVVSNLILGLDHDLNNIVNIGTQKETDINTVAQFILEELGLLNKVKINYEPAIPGELKRSCIYPFELLVKRLWYKHKDIKIRDGIRQTVSYFK